MGWSSKYPGCWGSGMTSYTVILGHYFINHEIRFIRIPINQVGCPWKLVREVCCRECVLETWVEFDRGKPKKHWKSWARGQRLSMGMACSKLGMMHGIQLRRYWCSWQSRTWWKKKLDESSWAAGWPWLVCRDQMIGICAKHSATKYSSKRRGLACMEGWSMGK